MGNARRVCSRLLTLGTGEGVSVGPRASVFVLLSHARNILTSGFQNRPHGTSSSFFRQTSAHLEAPGAAPSPFAPCCREGPCGGGARACVLFTLYTLYMKRHGLASQRLDARNVTALKLALSSPSPRGRYGQYRVLSGYPSPLQSLGATQFQRHLRKGLRFSAEEGPLLSELR